MAVAHYLEALEWQREFIKIHAVLGGKNPHLQTFLVGGMATPVDPDSRRRSTWARSHEIAGADRARPATSWPRSTSRTCSRWPPSTRTGRRYGGGVGNYLVYGEYPEDRRREAAALPALAASSAAADLSKVEPFDPQKITEYVKHSWYDYAGATTRALHPSSGETTPHYTGPEPPYEQLDTDGQVQLAQVAALRRPADGGRSARPDAGGLRLGPRAGQGAGRRRAQEAQASGPRRCSRRSAAWPRAASRRCSWPRQMDGWLDELADEHGGRRPAHPRQREVGSRPPGRRSARGRASTRRRAARSATGCTSRTERSRTTSASCRAPGTPARATRAGSAGPYEAALVGTPVADAETAPGDPAHRPLLRPLHGVRGARGRRRGRELAQG